MRRSQYTNAFRAWTGCSTWRGSVVNENDTVATHEIRFGDNDRLAALVAHLVRADALVLLSTSTPSMTARRRTGRSGSPRTGPHDLDGMTIGRTGKAVSAPGEWSTKVEAATIAAGSGIHALVTSTANAAAALAGKDVGHLLRERRPQARPRSGWRTSRRCKAPDARRRRGPGGPRPPHVAAPRGHFRRATALRSGRRRRDGQPDGTVIARGLVNYSAAELPQMLGRSTKELGKALGRGYDREVVHVDDLVLV